MKMLTIIMVGVLLVILSIPTTVSDLQYKGPYVPKVSLILTDDQREAISRDLRKQNYDRSQILCIALTVYGEAKDTSYTSQLAVAHVIVNRTKRVEFPNSACAVVLQPYQMEPIHSNKRLNYLAKQAQSGNVKLPAFNQYKQYMTIAEDAYYKKKKDPTNGATHFYSPKATDQLGRSVPDWTQKFKLSANYGGQKYYKM
jgi:spore germination cell wall hydrolase CwlJ-like protein